MYAQPNYDIRYDTHKCIQTFTRVVGHWRRYGVVMDDRDLRRRTVCGRRGLMIRRQLFGLSFAAVLHQQAAADTDTVLLMRGGGLFRRRRFLLHAAGVVTGAAEVLIPLIPVQHDRDAAFVVHYLPRRRLVLQFQRVNRFTDDFRYRGYRCTKHAHNTNVNSRVTL